MKLFLVKYDYEGVAAVIAANFESASELFTAAVQAWVYPDDWHRSEWPLTFARAESAQPGVDVGPDAEACVLGTTFVVDGWEMVFRSGQWRRTGHSCWSRELRDRVERGKAERAAYFGGEHGR